MSLRAYQQATARGEEPRSAEYRLFGQVTRALLEAEQAAADDIKTRIDALDWNRRLWSALASDCSAPENVLPPAVPTSHLLSIWVRLHSIPYAPRGGDRPPFYVTRIIMRARRSAQADEAPSSVPAARQVRLIAR